MTKGKKEQVEKLPTHEQDAFLTPSEVGRQIGKHHTTIGRWIVDGLLKAVRMPNNKYVLRQSEVNKFLGGSALTARVEGVRDDGETNSDRSGAGD